ncbi:MAG: type VI secretion system tube protein Hcp [Pseudomonadota bacterium]
MTTLIHIMANNTPLQGAYDDDVVGPDRTEVLSMYYDLSTPRTDESGRTSGRTVLSPVTIVKRMDQISPSLQDAMKNGQRIDAQISVLVRNNLNESVIAHQYTLVDSRVTGIRVELPAFTSNSGALNPVPLERVSIQPGSFINETLFNGGAESTFNTSEFA